MECCLEVGKLRNICKFIGFGTIFLWILFGPYGRRDEIVTSSNDEIGEVNNAGMRKLLSSNFSLSANESEECADIHKLPQNNKTLLCEFVSSHRSPCKGSSGLIHYFNFVYCLMPLKLIPLSMVILFFWLLFLFFFLGTTAEEYFCPALTIISQVLRLSQNIAGVTLLAFGNGAPDIFSALAAINQPDIKRASLAFGALLGAGMFVTTIVVGSVVLSRPFSLTQRPYMRDLIFYIAAVYWTFYILWNNRITIGISIGFIMMYLSYVFVVIFGRIIYQKWKKRVLGTGDIPRPPPKPTGEEMVVSNSTVVPTVQPSEGQILENGYHPNRNQISRSAETFVERPTVVVIDSSGDLGESGGNKTVITTTEATVHHYDSDHSRPSTPNQRCASRASQIVYGVSDEEEEEREREKKREHIRTPTPVSKLQVGSPRISPAASPRRLHKTISGALDITEDVGFTALGSNPNLAKIWHHAYRKELLHESGSRGGSPYMRHSPLLGVRNHLGTKLNHSVDVPFKVDQKEEEATTSEEDTEDHPLVSSVEVERPRKKVHPFLKLLLAFWPFGEAFQSLRIWGKCYEIVKIPVNVFLTLTVPVIDKAEDDDNWNRWLNVLHCVTAPVFISLSTKIGWYCIGGIFPLVLIVLVGGVSLAILVTFTSYNNKPPKYHCAFAWLGFLVAIVWIYTIANEIVNVLQVFGIVIDISDGILGITLLAWGNSIGDAVANVTMARQGFPRMAIGACIGGPLLNMLLGIGIAATVKAIGQTGHAFELYFTQVQMFAALFLLFTLSASLVITSCLRFRMSRPYGICLYIIYVAFLVVVILAEVKVFDIKIENVLSPF